MYYVHVPKLPSALETANLLVDNLFKHHGIPLEIVSNRGPQFSFQFWQEFCKPVGTATTLSSRYHPQSNCQMQQANQDVEPALWCVAMHHLVSWIFHLPRIEYVHNSLPSSATGMSLFMCCNGFQPPLFLEQEHSVAVPLVSGHHRRLQEVWQNVRAALACTADKSKRLAN